jgi:hypothetical protein
MIGFLYDSLVTSVRSYSYTHVALSLLHTRYSHRCIYTVSTSRLLATGLNAVTTSTHCTASLEDFICIHNSLIAATCTADFKSSNHRGRFLPLLFPSDNTQLTLWHFFKVYIYCLEYLSVLWIFRHKIEIIPAPYRMMYVLWLVSRKKKSLSQINIYQVHYRVN